MGAMLTKKISTKVHSIVDQIFYYKTDSSWLKFDEKNNGC